MNRIAFVLLVVGFAAGIAVGFLVGKGRGGGAEDEEGQTSPAQQESSSRAPIETSEQPEETGLEHRGEEAFEGGGKVRVPVKVQLPNGALVSEATIHVTASESSVAWSSGNPYLFLPEGTYYMSAEDERSGFASKGAQVLEVCGDGEMPTQRIVLQASTGLRGKIVLPEGWRPKSVYAYALNVAEGTQPDPQKFRFGGGMRGKSDWASQKDDYHFSFPDLEAGSYLLGAGYSYDDVRVTVVVKVPEAAIVTQDLELPPLDDADYVILRVLGPSGEALTEVDVNAGVEGPGFSSSGGGSTIPRADGSLIVIQRKDEDYRDRKGARYFIEVTSKDYGSERVEYADPVGTELTVQFQDSATLEVTIIGYAGSGYEDRVRLSLEGKSGAVGGSSRAPKAYSDDSDEGLSPDGIQVLGPVQPGDYELVLHMEREHHSSLALARKSVRLLTGENRASLSMPKLYALTVVVMDAEEGERVTLKPEGQQGWWGSGKAVGEDGSVVFEDLPPGSYSLMKEGVGMLDGMMHVNIPAQARVVFKPQPINGWKISIRDPSGYLGSVGLRHGDIILGIDGTEFTDVMQMQMLMTSAVSKETAQLMVRRGGSRLEVTVEMKKMLDHRNQGGEFEPTSR